MPRRRTNNSKNRSLESDDNPIGLTDAFAPVRGPQSVDYDSEDEPVGLTQAFGVARTDEERTWTETSKWKNFDWGNPDEEEQDKSALIWNADEDAYAEDAAISQLDEDVEEFLDDEDAVIDEEESAEKAQRAASKSKKEREAFESTKSSKSGPKHGRHAAAAPELTPRMKKSKRTRKVLIVLLILVVLVIGALGYFMYLTYSASQEEAVQQTQGQSSSAHDDISSETTTDAINSTTSLADVPDLTTLLGKNQDEAIALIGHGALVTANRAINEEGNPIKTNLNIALTEESADSKTGTPTVYLGLGEDGLVRQAGYSASAAALGFGALSFADAINNEHVIEETLEKAGVLVPEGSAVLPANKQDYTTYASDGTTVVSERSSFEGEVDVNGIPCVWSSVLSYDYTTQVVTGNLSDTVRIIYVYITMR